MKFQQAVRLTVLTITYHHSQIDFLALHIFKNQLGFLNTIIFHKMMNNRDLEPPSKHSCHDSVLKRTHLQYELLNVVFLLYFVKIRGSQEHSFPAFLHSHEDSHPSAVLLQLKLIGLSFVSTQGIRICKFCECWFGFLFFVKI